MRTTPTRTLAVTLAAVGAITLGSAAIAAAAGDSLGTGTRAAATRTASADPTLTATLTFGREEERLARDLYQLFSDTYGQAAPFSMIVRSEQQHYDAMGRLLAAYGIADPSSGRPAGNYADPALQALYDQWKAQGLTSQTEAAKVGVALEQRDIADLEKAIATTTQADVKQVLTRLLEASKHHLAAFTDAADGSYAGQPGMGGHGPGGPGATPGQGGAPGGDGRGPRMGAGNGADSPTPGMGNGAQGKGMGNGMGSAGAGRGDCPRTAG
ncbi:MAG TPA: DUF2202 domain-containing protein [Dermatophilaceae bacterium]|nr:DUF2202 domain-containing protein [Dermatophilaceae bacterium]